MVDLLNLNTYFPILFVVIAPIIGGLLIGIDRKLTARMQNRIGPPILQPFYDAIKLWVKQPFLANRLQPVLAFGYFGFGVAAYSLLAFGQDMLLIIFTITLADICMVVASFNSKSPYSNIGAKRELLGMMSCEPIMLLTALNISIMTGTFMIQGIFFIGLPLLPYLPLTLLAMIPVLIVNMKKSPFDVSTSGHAHQELVRGIYTEFSGYSLALIELGHWTRVTLILSFIALFWAQNLIAGAALALSIFFVVLIIDNIYPRLDWKSMVRTTWTVGFLLIIANIIVLIVRLVAL